MYCYRETNQKIELFIDLTWFLPRISQGRNLWITIIFNCEIYIQIKEQSIKTHYMAQER